MISQNTTALAERGSVNICCLSFDDESFLQQEGFVGKQGAFLEDPVAPASLFTVFLLPIMHSDVLPVSHGPLFHLIVRPSSFSISSSSTQCPSSHPVSPPLGSPMCRVLPLISRLTAINIPPQRSPSIFSSFEHLANGMTLIKRAWRELIQKQTAQGWKIFAPL